MAIKTVQEESLTAIGDAIRAKAGGQEPLEFPTGMIKAIEGIEAKPVMEPIVLTGDQSYGCVGYLAGQYIKQFGDIISTVNLTDVVQFFYKTPLKSIPFSINFKTDQTKVNLSQMFYEAEKLEVLPVINYAKPHTIRSFCRGCKNLREIPENLVDNWDLEYCHNSTSNDMSQMFMNCFSLRKIPSSVLKQLYHKKASYVGNSIYYQMFYCCYNLDEIRDLNIAVGPHTSNALSGIIDYATCLKSFTFAMNDDGTPKIAEWTNQVLSFERAGYDEIQYTFYSKDRYLYNSGRTINDCIYNDATYQLNKDNPNAYVAGYTAEKPIQYSRYNHDSAVETINSLPDTSAYLTANGGTNTIKFKGASGSATDGGAINTLTAEEIAMATAKGWTVSFV